MIDKKGVETRFENAVYRVVSDILKGLEREGEIFGNGNDIAQDIAAYAKSKLSERWETDERVEESRRINKALLSMLSRVKPIDS